MGRKRIKSVLLVCAAAVSAAAGILESARLTVKAAEEETYTVTFEAYEGICDMESISVLKGESITLPDGTYEGHCLESWMDIVSNGETTQFIAVGKPGGAYTPERDLRLYANCLIDGRKNNLPPKKKTQGRKPQKRKSVLAKLHKKQAEIAQRGGKKEHQQAAENDMEWERK